jgi:hypothetical protein
MKIGEKRGGMGDLFGKKREEFLKWGALVIFLLCTNLLAGESPRILWKNDHGFSGESKRHFLKMPERRG